MKNLISLVNLPLSVTGEYNNTVALNLYDSPLCKNLATQAGIGRYLRFISPTPVDHAIKVCLWEDKYQAWLSLDDLKYLQPAHQPYQAIAVERQDIESRLPQIIAFTKNAMNVPNYYLWGGTISPNYDCSGLIQAAFSAFGIWLPRDSYQQEAFTEKISIDELLPGDLIFFGTQKVSHVALYLGEGYYIHSSGKDYGRNGIGIDPLSAEGDPITQYYYQQLWSYGRVSTSYT